MPRHYNDLVKVAAARNRTDGARRTGDRKAQITRAAAELFHRNGYDSVTMGEIATAVGITVGALYRHFRSKQELLEHTVLQGGLAMAEAARRPDLDAALAAMASTVLDRRDISGLWQRETRHLPSDRRIEIRRFFAMVGSDLAGILRTSRPELSSGDADLLIWATLPIFGSPAFHDLTLPRPRFDKLMTDLGAAVCRIDTAGRTWSTPRSPAPAGLPRASRREALITAAAKLFHERGYVAVKNEDIGAAIGIAGPSIYNHFQAKSELLVVALTRAAEGLQLGAAASLAAADTARDALHLLLCHYVRHTLTHTDLARILVTESAHLPAPYRETILRTRQDYADEWAALIRSERPELTDTEALIITHAVLTMVNDVARTKHLRVRLDLEAALIDLGSAILWH